MLKLFRLSYYNSNYYNSYNKKEIFYLSTDRQAVIDNIQQRFKVDLTFGSRTKYLYDEESTTYKLEELDMLDLTTYKNPTISNEY